MFNPFTSTIIANAARQWRVLTATFLLLIGSVLVAHFNATPASPPRREPALYTLQPATHLQTPTPIERGFIWHPAGQPFLVYQNFAGGQPRLYDWTNGIPDRWQLVPTLRAEGVYHLVWQNRDGALWRAQINQEGERVLAAIEVARTAEHFTATTTRLGQTVLLWTVEDDVLGTVLDGFGRPLQQFNNLSSAINAPLLLDVQASGERQLYLSWLERDGRLYYGPSTDLTDFSDINSMQPTLAPGQWIDTLLIVVTETETYTLWTQADITRPAEHQLYALVWSSGEIITLLDGQSVRGLLDINSVAPDYVFPLFATSVRTDTAWQGAFVDLETDRVTMLDTMVDVTSAPQLWFDLQGNLQASAWSIFNDNEVRHIAQSPILRTPAPEPPPTLRRWLADGLLTIPQGLLWLAVVVFIWAVGYFGLRRQLEPLLLLGGYLGVQLIYPHDLFQAPSPLLDSPTTTHWDVALIIFGLHLLAGSIAAVLIHPRQPKYIWAFFTLDAVLIFVVFGANLTT
jgi:hypothetical protein